mgnify:FL=1
MFSELLEDECPFLLFKGKGENKKWQRRKKCVHQRITSRVQMLRKANPDMEETAIPVELVTCSDSRFLGVFEEKTVNVLKVNLMLDGIL